MRLIIVRHGETVENVTGISQGHAHGTLSEKGIEQARKVAQRLKDEKIDQVYSSDLGRARQTTEEILKYHKGIPVEYTAQLRELGKGKLDGKPRELREELVEKSGIPFYEYKFEGGESLIEVRERMVDFFEKLKKKHHNQTVLVVGHGGSLSCLFLHLENKGLEHRKEYYTKNTSVTEIEVTEKGHEIRLFDCTAHLNEAGDMTKKRRVAIIIFYDKDKRILLQDRKGISKRGEEWGYFGGGIEEGETPEQALVREIKEELDFDLKDYEFIGVFTNQPDDYKIIERHTFIAPLGDNLKKFRQIEGENMKLFTLEEARKAKSIKGDDLVLDKLEEMWT